MAYKKYTSTNLAQGPLAALIPASGEALQLETWYGALFPSSFPFKGILEKFDDQGKVIQREMVECTARTGDTLTIVRWAGLVPASWDALTQSNVPMEFASGDTFSLIVSSEQMDDVQEEVARLETDKLDKAGGALRTGMTAKRVLVTDASGNETELSGTEGQAVGFDAGGNPVATTPTVDIHGLPATSNAAAADEIVLWNAALAANRKMTLSDLRPEMAEYFFGNGSDGSLSISSGTTALTATNGFVVKQYEDLTISGTATFDLQGEFNILYVRGTFTMTAGTMTAVGRGGVGGTSTTDAHGSGSYGRTLDLTNLFVPGSGQTGAGSSTYLLSNAGGNIRVCSGAGGASGRSRTNWQAAGTGGNGGGVIIIIANRFNFTGGTITASGSVGAAPTYDGNGAGGGGSGGTVAAIVGTTVANTGTYAVNGGNGAWTPVGYSSGRPGGGGAGGYGASGGTGGNAGANGSAWGSNAYGTGGSAGVAGSASAYTGGGGGGGAAGTYYITSPKVT